MDMKLNKFLNEVMSEKGSEKIRQSFEKNKDTGLNAEKRILSDLLSNASPPLPNINQFNVLGLSKTFPKNPNLIILKPIPRDFMQWL